MPRLGGLFSRSSASTSSTSLSSKAFDEPAQLADALRGARLIVDDDLEGAEVILQAGDSAFHKLGDGIVGFLRATMGMEPEVIKDAHERLAIAESSASEAQRRSQRDASSYHSEIYPPGTEYALCHAESQIMGAIVGAASESMTEILKGFYKLRKAYLTLDAIAESEKKYLLKKGFAYGATPSTSTQTLPSRPPSTKSTTELNSQAQTSRAGPPSGLREVQAAGALSEDSDDEYDFFDAEEEKHAETNGLVTGTSRLSVDTARSSTAPHQVDGPDLGFFTDPIDAFIHSGTALNYGLLLTLLSIVPPSFSTLLNIVGFRGDRDRGLTLLWQATRFDNVNGAIAGLALLGYYNNVTNFVDIMLPDAYPTTRCTALLTTMRARLPQSRLWLLEEAKMVASSKNVERAIEMVAKAGPSKLKQVEALQCFETSLNYMYIHDYANCAKSFQLCIELNNWSHSLYYYIAGCAHIELYRDAAYAGTPDLAAAALHAEKAEQLLRKVPEHAGKKKFMSKQKPFDQFVGRKLSKWTARERERGVRLADAVGVSPIEEIIFWWNGFKRMRPEQLEDSLQRLAWSDGVGLRGGVKANRAWEGEEVDERAILKVMRAVVLRYLGRRREAKALLTEGVIQAYKWEEFKGGNGFKDNWPAPVARYEMAVNCWQDCEDGTAPDRGLLNQCRNFLEEVAQWESYDLDARLGIKITAARKTLEKIL